MTMHLERSRSRPRQLRRALNATDPTAKIIIPAESMFVFNGTSADLAQQFYQRYQAGDSLHKLDIAHNNLPKTIQDRLVTYKLKFKNLHSLLQRALIWDSGYVLDDAAKKLVKIYTANGTSMADIAVSYQELTKVAGCAAANCSSSTTTYRSGANCNGDKLTPVLKCASEEVAGASKQGSGSDLSMSFWATGGNHRAIPELSITQHTWEDSALNQTYSVNAIHSRVLSEESSSSDDCSVRLPSMIIPCARYADVSSSELTTVWGEPAPGKLVAVWLEHAQADKPGLSTTYMMLIVIGIVVGLVLLIVMCCKGQSRFKKRRQRKAEAKMTSADPQAFLDSSSDEVLAVSDAVPLTPVHAILESDLESAPSSTSSEWNNAFVSHRAVAGKRLRMDQLMLKKQIATGVNSEIWAAKYHGARVTVKKIIAAKARTQDQAEPGQSTTTTTISHLTPEFSVEIELLASLRHRNIVRFYGVAWDSPDSLCIITEYARKGNLHDLLAQQSQDADAEPKLTWDQIQRIMTGVASALEYLHARQEPVTHGNLRSRNVLLSSHFEPKLIGIGAICTESEPVDALVQHDYWRAPEVLQGAPSSLESDIYALGALFSELIVFSESSQASEQQVQKQQQSEAEEQKQGDEPVGVTSNCSQAIKDIVARCGDANPSARPRVSDIVQLLQQ